MGDRLAKPAVHFATRLHWLPLVAGRWQRGLIKNHPE